MEQSLYLIGIGFFAVLLHCMYKCNSLLKKAQAGNVNFRWKEDYLFKDYLSIIIAFGTVVLWYFVYKEFASNYQRLDAWKASSFVAVAWFGSYIVQKIMGNSEKLISDQIDRKTDQLNNLLGKPGDKTKL